MDRMPTREGQGDSGNPSRGETVDTEAGMHGVVGDRMAGSWSDVNQGSRSGARKALVSVSGPKSHPEGDRASVGARKRGNSRGAKGGRKSTIKRTESESTTDVVPERANSRQGESLSETGLIYRTLHSVMERACLSRLDRDMSAWVLTESAVRHESVAATGEPDARNSPVRFGGRGGLTGSPYPYQHSE